MELGPERYRVIANDSFVHGQNNGAPIPPANFAPYVANSGNWPKFGSYSRLRDYTSGDRVKPCDHFQLWGDLGNVNGGAPFYSDQTVTTSTIPYDQTFITRAAIEAKIGSPYVASFSAACLAAFTSFHTQVPDETDLPLTLLTIGDIGRLAEQVQSFALSIQAFFRSFEGQARTFQDLRRVPKFVRAMRQAFLGYQLGYKPTAADAYAMGGVYWHVLQRLEWLRKSYGKPTVVNFSRLLSGFDSQSPPTGSPGNASNIQALMVMGYQQCDFRAHATLLHRLEGLDSPIAMLRALGAGTGFGNPLLVAWDKIPYSFIVDWMLKFSSILRLVAFQPFQGQWTLTDVYYTLKHWGIIDVWEFMYSTYPGNSWRVVGHMNFRHFIRAYGLPVNVSDLLTLGPLSSTQQALIASLAGNLQRKL